MKKRKNNGILRYVAISLVLVIVFGLGITKIGKAQIEKSGLVELTEFANSVDGNVDAFQVGLAYLSEKIGIRLGATPGPNRYARTFSDNGVVYTFYTQKMRTATTTLCSFLNPFATSTIESFDYQITKGTSTAATLVVSASTGAFATTTESNIIAAQTVASGASDSLSWNSVAINDSLISPDDYILLSTESPGLDGYTYTGGCQIKLRELPN